MSNTNLPPFYVGQKVVCVKTTPYLKKNKEYSVMAMYFLPCCKKWSVYVGVKSSGIHYCQTHNTKHKTGIKGGVFHNSKYFAPVQENFQSISLEKVLEKETPLIGVN